MLNLNYRTFVDIDGVLADFVGGALAAHGVPAELQRDINCWHLWQQLGMTQGDFWGPLDNSYFWETLNPLADAAAILSLAEAFAGAKSCCLLSAPRPCPGSLAGKFAWVRSHLPHYLDRYLFGPTKAFAAQAGALLIDDSDEQVKAWRDAGGWAILLPRPWNSRRDQSGRAVEVLAEDLRRLELASMTEDA